MSYMRDKRRKRLDGIEVAERVHLTNPAPYFPNDRITSTGEYCVGVDEVTGTSFWSSTGALFLSSDGGATRTVDPGSNGGRPSVVGSAGFRVQCMKRQGSAAYWLALVLNTTLNRVELWRTPAVAPGTAMTWTKLADGFTNGTISSFGMDASPDGTTIVFGDYQLSVSPPGTGCKLHRLHSTDGGATFSVATDVYTISSTSKHFHDVYASRHEPGLWLATAGDGPTATDADYLVISTDDGVTWTSRTQAEFHRNFQAVNISEGNEDDPYIYLAPDVTYTDLVLLDRETLIPYASLSDHNKHAVPQPGTYFDGKSTNASATFTTAFSTPFKATDVGRRISGTNIQDGTTISAYTNAQSVTLSQTATATSSSGVLRFTIERPERWNQNCFFGRVDPETGIYYFLANDDQGAVQGAGAARYGLFALRPGDHSPFLIDYLPQNGFGIWIEPVHKRVYAGQISRPLLQAA